MNPVVVGDYAAIQTGGWERADGTLPSWLELLTDGWYRTSAEIIEEPASQEVPLGTSVTLRVVAVGYASITYQWRKNGVIVAGAVSDAYTISDFGFEDTGAYTVDVTCDGATGTSNPAILTVLEDDPEIISLYRGLEFVRRVYEPNFFKDGNMVVVERNSGGLPTLVKWSHPNLHGYELVVTNTYSGTNLDTVTEEIKVVYGV